MTREAQASSVPQFLHDWAAAWSAPLAIERLLAFYIDNVVQEDVTLGVVHRGKDELRRFAERYFAHLPDYRMAVRAGFLTDTAGAVEWAFTVTHTTQPLSGDPGTGKTLQARAASILGLRDGKVSRQTDYWDAATTMRQAGLLPATPTPNSSPPSGQGPGGPAASSVARPYVLEVRS